MEGGSFLTYLLQSSRIPPNFVTFAYCCLGIVGGVLLTLKTKQLVSMGLIIIFFKGILDLVDGHLARITNKVTEEGKELDALAGIIGTIYFYVGIAIYSRGIILPIAVILWLKGVKIGRANVVDTIILIVGLHLWYS